MFLRMHLLLLFFAPALVQGWTPMGFSAGFLASAAQHSSVAGSRVLSAHPGRAATAEAPATPGFINDVMRPYAMKLHTRAQAPKEGQAPAKEESKSMREWRCVCEGILEDLTSHDLLSPSTMEAPRLRPTPLSHALPRTLPSRKARNLIEMLSII
jgi:hypothetical protein